MTSRAVRHLCRAAEPRPRQRRRWWADRMVPEADDYFVSGCRCAPLALPDVWWHRAEIALEICSWHHDNIH